MFGSKQDSDMRWILVARFELLKIIFYGDRYFKPLGNGYMLNFKKLSGCPTEMEFVTHVTHSGSVKFLPAV